MCTFPALELCHTTHMLYSIGYLLIRRKARVCLKHEKKKLKTSIFRGEFVRHVSGASNWKVSLQENTLEKVSIINSSGDRGTATGISPFTSTKLLSQEVIQFGTNFGFWITLIQFLDHFDPIFILKFLG